MENQSSITIDAYILVGTLGMIILAVSIILFVVIYQKKVLAQKNMIQAVDNKHQKELLSAIIQVTEDERARVAKNIHDNISVLLNVAKLHLTKLSRSPDDEKNARELLKTSLELLDESIEGIRGIAKDLISPTLQKLGFEKGIAELCRRINTAGQINIALDMQFEEMRLPAKTELQLYRITQEMLNNIIKHDNAKKVMITTGINSQSAVITIAHDGAGISMEVVERLTESEKGIGLKSIQSRAQSINASIQYVTMGNSQAQISIEVPLTFLHEKAH